jgi:hypothetical protein
MEVNSLFISGRVLFLPYILSRHDRCWLKLAPKDSGAPFFFGHMSEPFQQSSPLPCTIATSGSLNQCCQFLEKYYGQINLRLAMGNQVTILQQICFLQLQIFGRLFRDVSGNFITRGNTDLNYENLSYTFFESEYFVLYKFGLLQIF